MTYLRDTSHALEICAFEMAGRLDAAMIGELIGLCVKVEELASRIETEKVFA